MALINDVSAVLQRVGTSYHEWVERMVFERWPRWQGHVNWDTQGVVYAEINASRWIVRCPTAGCGEAMMASSGLVFFCPQCLNMTNGGYAYEVIFPDEQTIAAIENVLSVRPLPGNRNWLPGETVGDLVAENIEHGLPGGVY